MECSLDRSKETASLCGTVVRSGWMTAKPSSATTGGRRGKGKEELRVSHTRTIAMNSESASKILFNLNDFLPPTGEWGVSFRSSDGDFDISIEYQRGDWTDGSGPFFARNLVFSR